MDAPDSPMTDDTSQSPLNSGLLSPPGSQGAAEPSSSANDLTQANRSMSTGASPTANINGKRPRNYISNGADAEDDEAERLVRAGSIASGTAAGTSSASRSDANGTTFATQVHEKSGYRWERPEDAPGYGWLNRKAQDESNRAWEAIVHKELAVKGQYGDPIELAEQEAAFRASLKES